MGEPLIEELAELEHDQWVHWTKYFLANLTKENIERWKKQIETPYSRLSEKEKESDKEWALKVLEIMKGVTISLDQPHKELFKKFMPLFGTTEADVIKELALRWVEANIANPHIVRATEICVEMDSHKETK